MWYNRPDHQPDHVGIAGSLTGCQRDYLTSELTVVSDNGRSVIDMTIKLIVSEFLVDCVSERLSDQLTDKCFRP